LITGRDLQPSQHGEFARKKKYCFITAETGGIKTPT